MICQKIKAFIKVIIILAIVGGSITMVIFQVDEYSDYDEHLTRITSDMMSVTCSDICGPDFQIRKDEYTCCSISNSCSSRKSCQVKKVAELDDLKQTASDYIFIFAAIVVIVLFFVCKYKCSPCRDLIASNNNNDAYYFSDSEPIVNSENQISAARGLPQSFVVNNHEDNCAICLQKLEEDRVIRLGCKHLFHGGCIREWIAQQNSCPVCRRPN